MDDVTVDDMYILSVKIMTFSVSQKYKYIGFVEAELRMMSGHGFKLKFSTKYIDKII
jgi:hypothetical protein